MSFPKGFVWGAATASYQVEGGAHEDGKGLSVWDVFCKKPGVIYQGQTGEIACDHYHRYAEDVALMRDLGLKAYRFSIAWPRIMPDGTGAINEAGLAFYDRLVDELLAAGVVPWPTLFHWDLPLSLYHGGGWMNSEIPKYFADYASVVVDRLSDRVHNWFTLNEPQCFVGHGSFIGVHAPGEKLAFSEVLLQAHHALLSHGLATQAIRARSKQPARVGFAPVTVTAMPASNSVEDIEAARRKMFDVTAKQPWENAWWMDPVVFGHYPEDGLLLYGEDVPNYTDSDMKIISEPTDFLGANIYHGTYVQKGEDGKAEELPMPPGAPQTAFRWRMTPEGLYWGPKFLYERYSKPIVISENGLSNQDWIYLDGKVHDPQRIDFLQRYLGQLSKAIDDGIPVDAYFHWSLMDNFEWAEGYKERFGLIYVDFQTQERTPKDSYYWYKKVISANGV